MGFLTPQELNKASKAKTDKMLEELQKGVENLQKVRDAQSKDEDEDKNNV